MPQEPIEAIFASPHILSEEQEAEYRELEAEGPLDRRLSRRESITPAATLIDLQVSRTKEGYHLVTFEKGKGEDPREFSNGLKWYITLTAAMLCLAVALGSSIITGDMVGPTREFGNEQVITNLTVTCFVMGFGIGPLFFAPLSEVFGRKPIYTLSMFLYFIFTLPGALAKNIETLVVCRMIAGLAASAPMCNIGGTIADLWAFHERGMPMAIFSASLFMGPCIGPMVGGWIGMRIGWRWIYWVLFITIGICFVLSLFVPETLSPIILRKKAEKLRKETGDDSYRTLEELERLPFSETIKTALYRPFIMLLCEPVILFMSFYLSFIYSLLYLMFFAFPIAFGEIRGFNDGLVGITFVSIMLGVLLALLAITIQEKLYRNATKNGSFPEARLYAMMFGAFILPASLFIFAFTGAYASVHWIGPCISGTIFGMAMVLIYISANSYIVDSYSNYAATAMAAKTFMRSEIGAMVPLFVNPMFHNMGFQYAGLLLALIGCVIAPMPFIFYKYGGGIRARSSRASQLQRISDEDAEKKRAYSPDEKHGHGQY